MSDVNDSSPSSVSESEGECSLVEETDMTVYSSAIQPYEDEPLAYDDAENVAGENGAEVAELEIDEDGIPYATLEARFEKREGVDKWCKCGECNVTELIGAVEYRCCKEVGPALYILTFDGSIEKINCITQHEDYLPLTHPAVLKQAGPLLRDRNGRSYRRRGNQTENELTRAVAYRWAYRWGGIIADL